MSSTTTSPLASSVASLRESLAHLESSISILAHGTADFPRLATVLSSTRHFEVTPSTNLAAAQAALAADLAPAVQQLVARAETALAKRERQVQQLQARSELLAGRLNCARASSAVAPASPSDGRAAGLEEKEVRLRALRQKKERLAFAVERLMLQSRQRQRQLRLSVAAT
ncbi:unnamed protein product [Blumeria hordei]|uniref:DASH complex subunit SPC19 n=2 Tax=Blumeria hordei TaxID=2867405 RepID=A0A383ULL4_BLUHO|nr:mitotic spindle biogenesis protein Spc19 [Blumeria hordei DH14]SZF00465.1 unnamed protein product [Blumeria hordei]